MAIPSPSSLLFLSVQLEDDIVAKPNYLSTMKNFALQQPSEDWMILEFSQLGFIGRLLLCWPHLCPCLLSLSPSTLAHLVSLAGSTLCMRMSQESQPCPVFLGPHMPKVCPQGSL